jgi:lipopolysaccharide/colanic/teichoic acid biosynthesis glycosyltransferase
VTVILLTAPVWATLMAGIAWWIKLVSRGPVLFKQERVGLGGARFVCLKFRTMHAGCATRAHEDHVRELMRSNRPMLKLDGKDSRLIPVASLLRATGLDELPQLFNVLRGEMSLVGPRPCTLQEYAEYSAPQRARLQVLPGLTGLWQVSGKNRTTFKEMIELDLRYVRLSCLWLDIEILRRTPVVLLTQVWEALRRRRNRGTPRAARRMNEAQAARATQFAERTRSHECRNN